MVEYKNQFGSSYSGKKVLITGHTGFKGSWLTLWLLKLGAKVYGISNEIPTNPSLFELLNLESSIEHHFEDIRNCDKISKLIAIIEPDFIFHLAAQPIVKESYRDPIYTTTTNVIGTVNVLEGVRKINLKCNIIVITSDKCYDNVEWLWGYKETDKLGGKDIYSASKGCAEIMIKAYYHSYFKNEDSNVKIVSTRAGNVIGGGDWADSRLIPDCVRSWSQNQLVEIRSPDATRPWQHVLEPLSGYLLSGHYLDMKDNLSGEAFNFGPNSDQNKTVLEIIDSISLNFEAKILEKYKIFRSNNFHEAGLLKLNCDKALKLLNWKPNLNFQQLGALTGKWYSKYYSNHINMLNFTSNQLDTFCDIARNNELSWVQKI